jgi:hypothetical protein
VLAGETVNLVSLVASTRGISKNDAHRQIADEAVTARERSQQILTQHSEALRAYMSFSHGFVAFHVESKRYRLDELNGGLR